MSFFHSQRSVEVVVINILVVCWLLVVGIFFFVVCFPTWSIRRCVNGFPNRISRKVDAITYTLLCAYIVNLFKTKKTKKEEPRVRMMRRTDGWMDGWIDK